MYVYLKLLGIMKYHVVVQLDDTHHYIFQILERSFFLKMITPF